MHSFIHSLSQTTLIHQLIHGSAWIAIFIIFSAGHMKRKLIFPTETRFLMPDPTIPLYSPPFISVLLPLSCEGEPPGSNHWSSATSETEKKKEAAYKKTFDQERQRSRENKTESYRKLKKRFMITAKIAFTFWLRTSIHPSIITI